VAAQLTFTSLIYAAFDHMFERMADGTERPNWFILDKASV